MVESKSKVIEAEAKGESWLQRNWRPITMLTFLVLVVCDSFGLLVFRLSNEAWTLLQIGIGGYVLGIKSKNLNCNVIDIFKKSNMMKIIITMLI